MFRLENISSNLTAQQFTYSVPIGPKKKGESSIYRHPASKVALKRVPEQLHSLSQFWDTIVKQYGGNKALEELTYNQVDKVARRVGSWLFDKKHEKLFLYAKNCVEWTVTDIGCWNYARVNVPLYDTLGEEAFHHILSLTEGTLIFTKKQLYPNLMKYLNTSKHNLNTVVFFDDCSNEEKAALENLGLTVTPWKELVGYKERPRPKMNLDQHITYGFTSGTTGLPKGVIYTHRNAIVQCLGMKGHLEYNSNDLHLSYLPIAHTFQRFVTWIVMYFGGCTKYALFPATEIVKDLTRVRPTILPMVPRLLNKLYPVAVGLLKQENGQKKLKGLFGGRLRLMVTGSAPISPQILTFFAKNLQIDMRQGYGQTETTAASFVTYKGDMNFGHVGGPNTTLEFKLVDVPEMNYTSDSNPPKGEICSRGDSIFTGYFKDPKNTNETLDEQAWNHSGDIGVILPNGALKIIDRKKNIYKLAQGEYIAPEKVQNIYLRCPYVAECFLYGNSLKQYNVAIIHPNLETLPKVAKELGIAESSPEKLCANKQIEAFILAEITKQGKNDGLLGFEQAKKIRISPVSLGSFGIFTSTMKLQRHTAKKAFEKEIEELYS